MANVTYAWGWGQELPRGLLPPSADTLLPPLFVSLLEGVCHVILGRELLLDLEGTSKWADLFLLKWGN